MKQASGPARKPAEAMIKDIRRATRRSTRDNRAAMPTVEAVSREVVADAQARSANQKVRYQWELLLGPSYCGSILKKPVNEITTLDIERILRPVWRSKPETGRKLLIRLRRVFCYARVYLRDRHGIVMQGDPAAWEDLRDRGFERIAKLTRGRQAALDYERVPEFLQAVRSRQGTAARALEVTLLTGLRTGEVIGATWDEIDLERRTWIIPPERLKDRRTRTEPHRIPLSDVVVSIFRALPRMGSHVFPGQITAKPLSNMALLSVLKKLNRDATGNPIWTDLKSGRDITPHGLRATFRTWGEDAGFARDLLEEALGHQIGNAVERAYRRTDSFERRRAVMQAWAEFCCPSRSVSS